MGSILVGDFPGSVEIAGKAYELNTDFRASLRAILAFQDSELTDQEKLVVLMENIYLDEPPEAQEAIEKASWFLDGGKTGEDDGEGGLFDFAHDASFIFAAFRQTHGIDLETASMHWWKFLALFMDLGSETTFCNLVALRKRHREGKTTKEENAAIAAMGDLFRVPQPDLRTPEEKRQADEFDSLAEAGRQRRKAMK